MPRVMIAAAASGGGKTTVTCALLRALEQKGYRAASFKCGPDYIDPMFHRESLHTVWSGNLDLFFCGPKQVRELLAQGSRDADIAVIEGVMGYYDGLGGISSRASSYDLAKTTGTPVIFAADCRGCSVSVCAQIRGFLEFTKDHHIAGILLNRMPGGLYPELKAMVETQCGLPVVGYLPLLPDCALESRHLGLKPAGEVAGLSEKLDRLAEAFLQTVDLEKILEIARSAPALSGESPAEEPQESFPVKIAVAWDAAFCFYYAETLALLERLGARLCMFSPLHDRQLPEGACGLLLGGGYPECYAKELSENTQMRMEISRAIQNGMPTIAECGGFLYLHESLEGMDGAVYPMAGVIPSKAYRTGRLGRFGYINLTAEKENLLCEKGQVLPAHEFHYWESSLPGEGFLAKKPLRKREWQCVHLSDTLYAGFPHLYLAGAPEAAARFLARASIYQKGETGNAAR